MTGASSTNSESKEGAIPISSGDVMKFVELQSSKEAMRRVCEYKGESDSLFYFILVWFVVKDLTVERVRPD